VRSLRPAPLLGGGDDHAIRMAQSSKGKERIRDSGVKTTAAARRVHPIARSVFVGFRPAPN